MDWSKSIKRTVTTNRPFFRQIFQSILCLWRSWWNAYILGYACLLNWHKQLEKCEWAEGNPRFQLTQDIDQFRWNSSLIRVIARPKNKVWTYCCNKFALHVYFRRMGWSGNIEWPFYIRLKRMHLVKAKTGSWINWGPISTHCLQYLASTLCIWWN